MPRLLIARLGPLEPSTECVLLREAVLVASNNLLLSLGRPWHKVLRLVADNLNMPPIPGGLRLWLGIGKYSLQPFHIIHECSFLDAEDDVLELPVESRIPVQLPPCQNESQLASNWVAYVELNSLRVSAGSVLDEPNGAFLRYAVAVVDVGPEAFDVWVVNVLHHVGLVVIAVAGRVVVVALSLPDRQHPIAHISVIMGHVFS